VAHDFNNLLGTILGFSSLLLEQTGAEDARRQGLEQIAHSAERASGLTAALLAFSRSARFERVPVSLNQVIEDCYQILRSTLEPSIGIAMKLEAGLPPLRGDALLLQQVVINLVQEVRDRLRAGDSLHLTTRAFDQSVPAEARESENRTRRMVALEIRTARGPKAAETGATAATGVGAGPAAEAQSAPPETEAGLALTIAEDITRAHGGYLVNLASLEAMAFEVVFPAERRDESQVITPETATARGHETIMVVDDEPSLRALAKSGLRQRGFDVVTVESGEQALEILRKGDPSIDLVVLDLTMPGLSGEKVLRAIRGFRPNLPVVIASGYATVQSQSSWVAAGAMGFLAKPYRIQDLASKLREILDRQHGRAGTG
jgi:CheY-like chemotaxis protein